MSIKVALKRALPTGVSSRLVALRTRLALSGEYRSDRLRYARHALPGEICRLAVSSKNLEAQLTKDYHRIEKGLALPEPKRPFGATVGDRIEGNITFGRVAGVDSAVALAKSAQVALYQWNDDGVISNEVAPLALQRAREVTDADDFFESRHSVRDFATTEVPDSILNHAVKLALHSPSVCNRQAWLIRFYRGGDVRRVLAFQNGNNGFNHVVPVVGLVTVDSRLFSAPGERNQPWIEGGIFSMSLVWALHALGLDSCMLNMSVRNRQSDALRREFGLGDNELVIMMIAIGYGRPGHRVARSPRRPVEEIIISAD